MMSVSGSQTLPVTYPIGTTVAMPMEDDKGTRPARISDGERCVIVGVVAEDVPMSVASSKRPTPPESHVHLCEDQGLLDNAVAAAPAASDTISPLDAANRVVAPGAAALVLGDTKTGLPHSYSGEPWRQEQVYSAAKAKLQATSRSGFPEVASMRLEAKLRTHKPTAHHPVGVSMAPGSQARAAPIAATEVSISTMSRQRTSIKARLVAMGGDAWIVYKWAQQLAFDHEMHLPPPFEHKILQALYPVSKLKPLADAELQFAIDCYRHYMLQYRYGFTQRSTAR